MEKSKICPHCGQELLSTAKKCKHCSEWIEKKCPYCGEWVMAEAKKCRHCGSWISATNGEKETATLAEVKSAEEIEDTAEGNSSINTLLYVEIFLLGFLFSYTYHWKWWMSALAAMLIGILLQIRLLRIVYCLMVSILWAAFGVGLHESSWAALLYGAGSLLLHWPAMKSKFNF